MRSTPTISLLLRYMHFVPVSGLRIRSCALVRTRGYRVDGWIAPDQQQVISAATMVYAHIDTGTLYAHSRIRCLPAKAQ